MAFSPLRQTGSFVVVFLVSAGLALAAEGVYPPLVNWSAPATWTPHGASRGVSTMSDISNPLPFVAITPCRQYDSRNTTPLAASTNRTITVTGAPCGIPAIALAVSLNITVFSITGATGNGVFLVGTSGTPTTAWINYPPTETQRGNAGVLPTPLVVRVEQGGGLVNFTVDVNGYYPFSFSGNPINSGEFFGIYGNYNGGAVNFGANYSSVAQSTGIRGRAASTTGVVWGVQGETLSTSIGAAGVVGLDLAGSLPPGYLGFERAGVLGASSEFAGVLGYSLIGGATAAVVARCVNLDGTLASGAYLGSAADGVGVRYINGLAGTGSKSFVEPHPTDPTKIIKYASLEGPEVGTYFRGTARIVHGQAVITVPEDFRMVTTEDGLTVQLTPLGAQANMWIISEDLNQIVVRSSKDVMFHYMVNGVRRAFKVWDPIQENKNYFAPESPDAKLPTYLSEDERNRLISNGTYNPDGAVNLQTARALGWDKQWAARGPKPVEPLAARPPQ